MTGAKRPMVEYALDYARRGWKVFPLAGKIPLKDSHGFEDATTDETTIRSWWNENPMYNIGIATGQTSGGLVVLDLDRKNGKDGYQALAEWQFQNRLSKAFPDTVKAISGTGGEHWYYQMPECYLDSRIDILSGIDSRANKGYIVAPPSIHPETGVPYQWGEAHSPKEIRLAEVTPEILLLLTYERNKGQAAEKPGIRDRFKLPGIIEQGQRDDTIFRYACQLRSQGIPEEEIAERIRSANEQRCRPPMDDQQIRKIIRQAINYPPGEPMRPMIPEPAEYKEDDLTLTPMDEVEETEVEWLIPGYIVKGTLNVIFGSGGVGKTSVWTAIAAAISTGKQCFLEGSDFPLDKQREPGTVLFFSSEDQISKSLHKRLRKSGGDMKKIFSMELSDERFSKVHFNSRFLENLIRKYKPMLIIFDPLQSFIPPDVNMSSRNAMRQCCQALIGYGETYGVTSIIICHSNKRNGVSGRDRMSDSSDIWDIARCVLAVGTTPDDKIRYISQEKISDFVGSPTVLFKIADSIPVYHARSEYHDQFYQQERMKLYPAQKRDDCIRLIIEYLQRTEGGTPVKDLDSYLKANNCSEDVIRRSKETLRNEGKIQMRQTGYGKDKRWYISLTKAA